MSAPKIFEFFKKIKTNENSIIEINNLLKDTDWRTVSLTNDFKPYNDLSANIPKYRKVGKLVEVRGVISPKATILSEDMYNHDHIIFVLPADCRPKHQITFIQQGSQKNSWLLNIFENGNVTFERYGTNEPQNAANNVWLSFQAMFFVD